MSTSVLPQNVFNPRFLEIAIPRQRIGDDIRGPVVNRLLIYTGTFSLFPFALHTAFNDDLARERYVVDLSELPGHPVFDGDPLLLVTVPNPNNPQESIPPAAPVASLASIGWDDQADRAVWAADTAHVTTDDLGHLFLEVDSALAGAGCGLGRISYQVNLLAYRSIRGDVLARVSEAISVLFR